MSAATDTVRHLVEFVRAATHEIVKQSHLHEAEMKAMGLLYSAVARAQRHHAQRILHECDGLYRTCVDPLRGFVH